jgi:hypothetical protein
MPKSFDADLAHLDTLRPLPPAETLAPLRKFLTHKSNFLVAKAARITREHDHRTLTPDLVQAFHRFLVDAATTDPQCWAKNALIETLAAFDYQEPEPFLAGIEHHQLESTWGGQVDTAGPLRGQSALALVTCRGMSSHQVLHLLTPLFADVDLPVQVNAARAVEQIGTDSSVLLLKLRAELASGAPELLGACYSGVLRLEGPAALPWATRFLNPKSPDEASTEAAFAIADLRTEAAARALIATHKQTRDRDFRDTLLTALALTRHETAIDFLFTLIAEGNPTAREALEHSAPTPEVQDRLRTLK